MNSTKSTINRLFITLFLFTLAPEVFSESAYKRTIYNTFINREMYKWGSIIHATETGKPLTTVDQKLELVNLYYGYIGHLIGKKQYDIAENMIKKGEKIIHQVLQVSPRNATAYAYKGSFLGFRMGISKFRTFTLARESIADINKAYALDPQNVQAIIDKGNFLYYTPKLFGGDKDEALEFYLRGSRILERNRDTDQNWVYLNLLTNIALTYEKTGNPDQAIHICQKILRKEPNFRWVRDVFYPRLLDKKI